MATSTVIMPSDNIIVQRAQAILRKQGINIEDVFRAYLDSIVDDDSEQDYVLLEQMADDEVPQSVLDELDYMEKHGTDHYISKTATTHAYS